MTVSADDIIEAIKKAIKMIEEIISDLNDLFEEMESFETKKNVAKTVGTTVNCVGAGAAVVGAFFTGGLSLIPLLVITAVGTGTNVVTDIIDNSETKDCIKKIQNMLEKVDNQMRKIQSLIEKFNEQVEDSMKTRKIDRNRATFLHFGCQLNVDVNLLCFLAYSRILQEPLAHMIVGVAGSLQVVSKTFGFLLDDVALLLLKSGGKSASAGSAKAAATFFDSGPTLMGTAKAGASAIESGSATVVKAGAGSVGKVIGKVAAGAGVVFAVWEVADLIKTMANDHPSLKAIRSVKRDLQSQKSELNTGLKEFEKVLTAARKATTEAIKAFLDSSLGGGYRISPKSTVAPLKFAEFVNQIGRGTEGGIFQLIFMAEMLGQTIEVFDKTTDRVLRRQHGTGHLKITPFRPSFLNSIRIEMIGEKGAYHYRPLSADGNPIEVASNSPYANRCLFDAIAYQLRLTTDALIERFRTYLRSKPEAEELFEENVQEIFPEFIGGARRARPDAQTGQPAAFTRTRVGNQETVAATVRLRNLWGGTPTTARVRNEILDRGIRGWDHAGHILANVLGGPGNNIDNFDPMHRLLNMGEFKSFELQLRNVLVENPTWRADITVVMTYDPNSDYPRRPTNFNYKVKYFNSNGAFQFEREKDFENYLPEE